MSAHARLLIVGVLLVAACGRHESTSGAARSGRSAGSGSPAGSGAVAGSAGSGQHPPTPAEIDKAIEAAKATLQPPAHPDGTLQLVGIDVLTAPDLFKSRAAGAGPKPMEPLVAAAKAAVAAVDGARAGQLGDTVVVWIALRPGKKLKTWIACPRKADTDAARADIAGRMATATAPEVTGQVAFAVTFDRSGARSRTSDIPMPPELEAVRGPVGDAPAPDVLIERAWKP